MMKVKEIKKSKVEDLHTWLHVSWTLIYQPTGISQTWTTSTRLPLDVARTSTAAAGALVGGWKFPLSLRNISGRSAVFAGHAESNMEVFLHRVGVQLEGWEASEETELLDGCRPYSKGTSHNQTHRISLLFNSGGAHSSVSSKSRCVSSVRPFKKNRLCAHVVWHNISINSI